MATDCIFCRIAAQEIKTPLLYSDNEVVAFRDLHPQAPQHLLVVPRRHVQDLSALAAEGDVFLLGRLLQIAARAAATAGIAEDGFRVVMNTGPEGGQSVMHLHLHVLGGRQMEWPPG